MKKKGHTFPYFFLLPFLMLLSFPLFASTSSATIKLVATHNPTATIHLYLTAEDGQVLRDDAQLDFEFPNSKEAWERTQTLRVRASYQNASHSPVTMSFHVTPFTHQSFSSAVIPTTLSLEPLSDDASAGSGADGSPELRLQFSSGTVTEMDMARIAVTARKEAGSVELPSGRYSGALNIDITSK